jgi:hypothetical protein
MNLIVDRVKLLAMELNWIQIESASTSPMGEARTARLHLERQVMPMPGKICPSELTILGPGNPSSTPRRRLTKRNRIDPSPG